LAGPVPAGPNSAAGIALLRKEVAEAVSRAVAELPPPLREVLVLRHYEGMRFEAIARLTGVPATTLKSRFAAALSRLRSTLRVFEEEIEP
jgi:RNA polymerase sigma-70 factor (ECF subfamily)